MKKLQARVTANAVSFYITGFIPLLFSLFLISSCGVNSADEGDVMIINLESVVGSGRVVNLSEVADDIRYVALETTDSSLIGSFPTVFYENERIYVISMRVVKVFDKDGKYLFTFDKRGRGPMEYTSPRKIVIEPESGDITIIVHSADESKILTYDRDGNYLNTKFLPVLTETKLDITTKITDNFYVASLATISRGEVDFYAVAFDSLSNLLFKAPKPTIPENAEDRVSMISIGIDRPAGGSTLFFNLPLVIYKFDNNARLITGANDTIFNLNTKLEYSALYAINFGKYKNLSKDRNLIDEIDANHISLIRSYFIESKENILLKFNLRGFAHEPFEVTMESVQGTRVNKRRDCYALFNKGTGLLTLLNLPIANNQGFMDDIMMGPPFLPTAISSRFEAVSIHSASRVIEHAETNSISPELAKIVSKLNDTDNPVVSITSFK
jgi:hypothetical protein